MRSIISAKYLPLLAEFRAPPDDVRYYLHGIAIEPHEIEGAYLCATDGHRLVVIHDEMGVAESGACIVNPDPIVIAQAKGATLADFDGTYVDLQDEEEELILRARAPSLDGKFPDWRALVRDNERSGSPGSLSPDLIASIRKAPFPKRAPKQAMFFTDTDKPSIIRLPQLPEIMVLIAPQRLDGAMRDVPEWVRRPSRKAKREEAAGQNALDLGTPPLPDGVSVEVMSP
jgi:hypothetical protein